MKTIQLYTIFELPEPFFHDWKWIENDMRNLLIGSDEEVESLRANQINNHLYITATFILDWSGDFAGVVKSYINDLANELNADIIYINLRTDEIITR